MTENPESFSIPVPLLKALANTLHCMDAQAEDGLDHETLADFAGHFYKDAASILSSIPEPTRAMWEVEFAND